MKIFKTMGSKIITLTILGVFLTTIALIVSILLSRASVETIIVENNLQIDDQNAEFLKTIARTTNNSLDIFDSLLTDKLKIVMANMKDDVEARGGFAAIRRAAINTDGGVRSPIVDDIMRLNNCYSTIFVKQDDNSMLRVMTNIIRNNQRAVNTSITQFNADGTPNAVIQSILAGKTFIGRAQVLGEWVSAIYEPIIENGNVVGMLFVSNTRKDSADFVQRIRDSRYGNIFAIGGTGPEFGLLIMPLDDDMKGVGSAVLEKTNSKGERYWNQIVEFAQRLPEDTTGFTQILFQSSLEGEQELDIALMYNQNWNWIIGVAIPRADLEETGLNMQSSTMSAFNTLQTKAIVVGLVLLIIFIFISLFVSKQMTKPLLDCVEYANQLAEGNEKVEVQITSNDETSILASAIQNMARRIKRMYDDATFLAQEAMDGKLKARVDEQQHRGCYANIIANLNNIIVAVETPIKEAMNVMDSLAHKDMTNRIIGNYKGEFEEFKENVNLMARNLEDSLAQVEQAVEQISAASNEISSGSQELAESTSVQASSLEEISSSLEEINSLTRGNADNAKSSLSLAEHAMRAVDQGNAAMDKMNKAMDSILKSSQETGKIIKTIDEIAFQTNLLALNAAVEAAHAGDAGKGFAVVAEEVKNLALRSAEAARNTNTLIDESAKNSEMGANIVEQVYKSFAEMKDQFNKVKSIVNEIAASSDEQAQGVNQISTSVNEMNMATQKNAANAEESAAAAEQLNSSAMELKSMVREYNLSPVSVKPQLSSKPQNLLTFDGGESF
jgi:methyl-accepting chemotaxis protein